VVTVMKNTYDLGAINLGGEHDESGSFIPLMPTNIGSSCGFYFLISIRASTFKLNARVMPIAQWL
jgi:hypothetical protein